MTLPHIYERIGRLPPNIITLLNGFAKVNPFGICIYGTSQHAEKGAKSVVLPAAPVCVMIHPSKDQQDCCTVINVKIEEHCPASLCTVGGKQQHSVFCCLFPEPSGMPAGVWARSASASEIEVNWQALSFTPERVLGYEVNSTLLNGNRNNTHNTIQMLVINPCWNSKPSLPNYALPWKWPFQLGKYYSQNYTVLCTSPTENMSEGFQENKRKLPVHMPGSYRISWYRASWQSVLQCCSRHHVRVARSAIIPQQKLLLKTVDNRASPWELSFSHCSLNRNIELLHFRTKTADCILSHLQ